MQNYMHDITPDMVEVADRLMHNGFEGATAEEIETYTQFKIAQALQSEEFSHRAKLREEESKAQMQASENESAKAIEALQALTDLAKARLKAVEDGQK